MLTVANGTFRCAPGQLAGSWPTLTERMVKYIANSAAKNMSSEDSQMIVPTLTKLGRRDEWAVVVVVIADAVATPDIIAAHGAGSAHGPPIGRARGISGRDISGPPGPIASLVTLPGDWSAQHEGSRLQRRRGHP
ncbi:hypothetical protein HerbRD11066_04480 [Herbidospora sp. RD11066]